MYSVAAPFRGLQQPPRPPGPTPNTEIQVDGRGLISHDGARSVAESDTSKRYNDVNHNRAHSRQRSRVDTLFVQGRGHTQTDKRIIATASQEPHLQSPRLNQPYQDRVR